MTELKNLKKLNSITLLSNFKGLTYINTKKDVKFNVIFFILI